MRVQVSSDLSRRVAKLAGVAQAKRFSVPGGVICFGTDELDARNEHLFGALAALPPDEQGAYLLVPPILSLDVWEAEAQPSQEQLVRDTGNWLGPPVTTTEPDVGDGSHRYRR